MHMIIGHRAARLGALLAALTLANVARAERDHHALDATLHARSVDQTLAIEVAAEFPDAPSGMRAYWEVLLRAPDGRTVKQWHGELLLADAGRVRADMEQQQAELTPGWYGVELRATAIEPWMQAQLRQGTLADRVTRALRFAPNGIVEQRWDVPVGALPRPQMPAFSGLPYAQTARAQDPPGGLPYRIYLANLHSQTNHSDGGGEVSTCSSSQGAQTGEFGPADAYAYAMSRGLDVLVTSEHNHYFDGSSNTNSSATPAAAIGLYQSGVQAALAHNQANPDFLALYGMEWGVISSGGHLNIFGGNQLYGWEYNASNQLLAEVYTAKSEYAPLYTLMQQNGLIGQFNHPATGGQFLVDGVALGYHPAGDEVMVLSEILNTSAFSNDTTETETGRSSYESAFNRLLERGYHVAPATNQDNHCANWGMSYTNRTGVLIPAGTALSPQSFLDALRARRVYATMDRSSQIVLRAGSRLMGERIQNSGPLTLEVLYATTGGHTVSRVQIQEGVPGRNGTVTTLIEAPTHTFTPTPGLHFYYAKITQEDGDLLWSAPIWVEQLAADPVFANGYED